MIRPKKIIHQLFLSMIILLTTTILVHAQVAPLAEQAVPTVNAKLHCGAIGDGVADDTQAIQQALDMAIGDTTIRFPESPRVSPRRVYLPPGKYRITQTLIMTAAHTNLTLYGAGSRGGEIRAMSQLVWDGANDGILMQSYGQMGLVMSDIRFDGNNKAKTAFALDSIDSDNDDSSLITTFGARGAAMHVLTRCSFENATVGYRCGQDSWTCASDLSFYDCNFSSCETGFLTMADQNLNYFFTRPNIALSQTGMHFAKGGSATIHLLNGHSLETALKIDKGGINAGIFSIHGMRVESRFYNGKRTSLIHAEGETNVYISGLLTTCMGIAGTNGDPNTPMITLRKGAQLTIEGSQLSGMIADIATTTGQPPAWLSFRECRFRFLADPRTNITCDTNSGYDLTNCIIYRDHIDEEGVYRIDGWDFVENIKKLPDTLTR